MRRVVAGAVLLASCTLPGQGLVAEGVRLESLAHDADSGADLGGRAALVADVEQQRHGGQHYKHGQYDDQVQIGVALGCVVIYAATLDAVVVVVILLLVADVTADGGGDASCVGR